MSLVTNELWGTRDKVGIAIARIKDFEPMAINNNPAGYHVCISGGKDSSVIQQLCIEAGVRCEFVHSHTSIDHPETVRFVRGEKTRLEALGHTFRIEYPRTKTGELKTMWGLIARKGYPTPFRRFCCSELKEFSGLGRYIVTGVRWEESAKRKIRGIHETIAKKTEDKVVLNNDNDMRRKMTEICMAKHEIVLNPIIDWTSDDVWEYIRIRKLPYNPLYDQGCKRVGCVGCPMNRRYQKEELDFLPKYKQAYINAGGRYLEYRRERGLDTREKTGLSYYDHWVNHWKVLDAL